MLKQFISFKTFSVDSLGFLYMRSRHLKIDSFTSSLPIWMSFIIFCLAWLPCLEPPVWYWLGGLRATSSPHSLSAKSIHLSPSNTRFTLRFSQMSFFWLRRFPSIHIFLDHWVLFSLIVKMCLIVVKCFFCSSWDDHVVLFFILML